MNLRSAASRVRRKQQDQQCPDTDRLLTLDGIFGDAISTADIPDPDIDRSHVVPVVASSPITSQTIDDGLHNIGLSDEGNISLLVCHSTPSAG